MPTSRARELVAKVARASAVPPPFSIDKVSVTLHGFDTSIPPLRPRGAGEDEDEEWVFSVEGRYSVDEVVNLAHALQAAMQFNGYALLILNEHRRDGDARLVRIEVTGPELEIERGPE